MLFWWVLMIKFCMVLKLKIRHIFNFSQDFHLKSKTSSHSSPLKIFQKKKEKKRKPSRYVEGFKKASFFEKILLEWREIFSKTRRAWTCFFVNLEQKFVFFFFLYFFWNFLFNLGFVMEMDFWVWSTENGVLEIKGSSKGVGFWNRIKNNFQINMDGFILFWNFTLFVFWFDFCECL